MLRSQKWKGAVELKGLEINNEEELTLHSCLSDRPTALWKGYSISREDIALSRLFWIGRGILDPGTPDFKIKSEFIEPN